MIALVVNKNHRLSKEALKEHGIHLVSRKCIDTCSKKFSTVIITKGASLNEDYDSIMKEIKESNRPYFTEQYIYHKDYDKKCDIGSSISYSSPFPFINYELKVSELLIGLEYLLAVEDEPNFIRKVFSLDSNMEEIKRYSINNRLYAKYLDRKDVEELGFVYNKFLSSSFSKVNLRGHFNDNSDYAIRFYAMGSNELSKNGPYVKIEKRTDEILNTEDYGNVRLMWNTIFEGIIKNKSELIKIMIQLKIE